MTNPTPTNRDVAVRTGIQFLVVAAGILLVMFLGSIRPILLQLLIALILAMALSPLVKRLSAWRMNRVWASITALLITTVAMGLIVTAIASPLLTQGGDLIKNAPTLVERATANPAIQALDRQFHLVDQAHTLARNLPNLLAGSGSPLLHTVSSVLSAISTLGIVLIVALFMLIEGPTAWAQLMMLLGNKERKVVGSMAAKILVAISGFVSGNLLISLIAGIVSLVLLLILGIPYALALAALVAVFDLIPLVGATLATVVLGLVALSKGIAPAAILVAGMLVYQFVEGNIIQPVIYGRTVKLSQLLIIVASIVGGALGGIIGVLLAIPVAAALQIIVVESLKASGVNLEPPVDASMK